MRKYTRYSAEFKREAVRLLESGDKSATDVAMDLGIGMAYAPDHIGRHGGNQVNRARKLHQVRVSFNFCVSRPGCFRKRIY